MYVRWLISTLLSRPLLAGEALLTLAALALAIVATKRRNSRFARAAVSLSVLILLFGCSEVISDHRYYAEIIREERSPGLAAQIRLGEWNELWAAFQFALLCAAVAIGAGALSALRTSDAPRIRRLARALLVSAMLAACVVAATNAYWKREAEARLLADARELFEVRPQPEAETAAKSGVADLGQLARAVLDRARSGDGDGALRACLEAHGTLVELQSSKAPPDLPLRLHCDCVAAIDQASADAKRQARTAFAALRGRLRSPEQLARIDGLERALDTFGTQLSTKATEELLRILPTRTERGLRFDLERGHGEWAPSLVDRAFEGLGMNMCLSAFARAAASASRPRSEWTTIAEELDVQTFWSPSSLPGACVASRIYCGTCAQNVSWYRFVGRVRERERTSLEMLEIAAAADLVRAETGQWPADAASLGLPEGPEAEAYTLLGKESELWIGERARGEPPRTEPPSVEPFEQDDCERLDLTLHADSH